MSDFKHPRSYVLFCSNFKSSDHLWPIKLHTGRQLFRRQLLQSASPHTIRGSGCTGYSWEKPLTSERGGSHESVWGWGVSIEGLPQGPGFLPLNWGMRGMAESCPQSPSVTLSHSLLPGALPQRVIFSLMYVCTRVYVCEMPSPSYATWSPIGLELTDQAKEAGHRPWTLSLFLASHWDNFSWVLEYKSWVPYSQKIALCQVNYPSRCPDTTCIDYCIVIILEKWYRKWGWNQNSH